METIIKVQELSKCFGRFRAVDAISFDVKQGEIFGFLGANGAGKSTAMRMLCGLSKPTSGTASVAGYDIARERESVKRNIGYMSQRFALYDDLKVWENIRFFAGIYGMKSKEIARKSEEMLHKVGLYDERNSLAASLPLGWKQKLAFSISIFHSPKVLFLDEPTGGVDPITRRRFWEMISEVSAQGTTVFVTTHYMDEAEYCDRVTIMVDGRIAALDTPKQIKEKTSATSMEEVFTHYARKAKRT